MGCEGGGRTALGRETEGTIASKMHYTMFAANVATRWAFGEKKIERLKEK